MLDTLEASVKSLVATAPDDTPVAVNSREAPANCGSTYQDVLIVPSLAAKREAQVLGLGAGFLPEPIAREEEAAGRLVIKRVASQRDDALLRVAWRTGDEGRACAWFRDRVVEEAKAGRLIPSIAPPSTASARTKTRTAATKSKAAS